MREAAKAPHHLQERHGRVQVKEPQLLLVFSRLSARAYLLSLKTSKVEAEAWDQAQQAPAAKLPQPSSATTNIIIIQKTFLPAQLVIE